MADVRIQIKADSTGLQNGLTQAEGKVQSFAAKTSLAGNAVSKMQAGMVTAGALGSKAMAGLQAAMGPLMIVLGAFMGMKGLSDLAGQINDLSQRFGATAESIQRLKYAADQSGTSIETLAKALNKAELAAVAAARGNEEMNQAFQALGLSASEFAGLPMEEKLAAIAEGYDNNTNKAEALDAMVKIMGKSASELIPLFAQGGEAITAMMDQASVASTDSIARIDEVSDRVSELFSTLKVWAMESLGFIIDMIDKMSVGLVAMAAYVGRVFEGTGGAQEVYQDTLDTGLDYLEERKKQREERKNKVSAANITQIEQDTKEEEKAKAKEKEDAKPKALNDMPSYEDWKDAKDKEQKEIEKAAKAKAKKEKEDKTNKAEKNLDNAENALDKTKRIAGNKIDADQLRRIGGGFAKSNYAGVSKEAQAMQKQIDLQQKQVDHLKSLVDAVKGDNSLDGISN